MYFKNQNNAQIVDLALAGHTGRTKTGAMSVDRFREGYSRTLPYSGSLRPQWRKLISERFHMGKVVTAIYSYSTIIAWEDADYGWIVPAVTYSPTTSSKHDSRPALRAWTRGMTSHTCHVDCTPVVSVHSVTGKPYTSHVMFAAEPSSAAGRYQWERNREILDKGRRAWRVTGQGQSRACRVWSEKRRSKLEWLGQNGMFRIRSFARLRAL